MKQSIEAAVAAIFEDYQDSPQLRDFREEITTNLLERVRDLIGKGTSEAEAVGRALAELGDITEIAEGIGRQKRKEAIGDFYFSKKPLDRKHAVGYPVAAALLVLGLVVAFIFSYQSGSLGHTLVTLLPFGLAAGCAFVYLGLTQDTRAHYPMKGKRAALFSLAAGLMLTGAFLGGAALFWNINITELSQESLIELKAARLSLLPLPSLLVLLVLVLPGGGMLAYLTLTQEKRLKPWVREQMQRSADIYHDVYDERFGLACGAIWTFAIAMFVLLGFLIGWHPAWVVFLFAIAVQLLVMVFIHKKAK